MSEPSRTTAEPQDVVRSGAPRAAAGEVLLAAQGVRKSFPVGERLLEVLHGADLELRRGELLALMGPSGAGKSTLLHILGLLDPPSEGRVVLEGQSAWELPPTTRARLRNQRIGFVFQFYHLLPELDALENVVLPAMIAHSRPAFRRRRTELFDKARALLASFGLEPRLRHRPSQLSGGERQRVALARALFHDPPILIADEPTGNLDSGTGEKVLELLFREQERRRISLLLVTHDERLAARCQRTLYMDDGQTRVHLDLPARAHARAAAESRRIRAPQASRRVRAASSARREPRAMSCARRRSRARVQESRDAPQPVPLAG